MKIKRFLSVFLLCACLTGLFLTPAASALDIPDIQAKAALLVDVNTDAVAYAKNIHEKNYSTSCYESDKQEKINIVNNFFIWLLHFIIAL